MTLFQKAASQGAKHPASRPWAGNMRPGLLHYRLLGKLPSYGLIYAVRAYQIVLSPLLGARCRFYPSCSQYFIESVRKYGALRGMARGMCRLARCHPFHTGGYDPP